MPLWQGEGDLCPTCGVCTCRVGHVSPRVGVRAGSTGRQMANLLAVKPCQALNEITPSALIPPRVRWGGDGMGSCGLGRGDGCLAAESPKWVPAHL